MAGGLSFAEFNARHLDPFIEDIERDRLKTITRAAGRFAQATAEAEASRDLGGDPKFSGWAPSLDTRVVDVSPGVVSFRPTARSAGPWTVAEFGRNQGNASGLSGPGISADGTTRRTKSGGVRAVRARRARRWNGVTQGKGTASRAVVRIEAEVPKIVDAEVGKAIRKFFR